MTVTPSPASSAGPSATPLFATADPSSQQALRDAVALVLDAVATHALDASGSWSGLAAPHLADEVGRLDPCPPEGVPLAQVVEEIGTTILAHSVRTTDPGTVAHLHCPTLIPAAATELAIGVLNQSMDSFDQAPAATFAEDHLVRWLASLTGLGPSASGIVTAGGTASNLLGLTLARARAARRAGCDVAADGLPAEAARWKIVCSDAAHFSVQQAAALLGLGHRSVVPVATDAAGRLDVAALDAVLAALAANGEVPIALVATAGTTDLGAVDPLRAMADRAHQLDLWFHVDAAVGSAFLLSPTLAPLLDGIERADSVTADLHKLWWQPIGASALLVRDAAAFELIRLNSTYLNRAEDEDLGVVNLVTRSLDTSRRFDALKVLVSLRTVGRRRMGAMVDHVAELATATGRVIASHPDLELAAEPQTVTCVFRWRGRDLDEAELDRVNTAIQRSLFASGEATVGRTTYRGRSHLKLTLINPLVTLADTTVLLDRIAEVGHLVCADHPRTMAAPLR